jgi:hypothetical protein
MGSSHCLGNPRTGDPGRSAVGRFQTWPSLWLVASSTHNVEHDRTHCSRHGSHNVRLVPRFPFQELPRFGTHWLLTTTPGCDRSVQVLPEPNVRRRPVRLDWVDGLLRKSSGFCRASTPVVIVHLSSDSLRRTSTRSAVWRRIPHIQEIGTSMDRSDLKLLLIGFSATSVGTPTYGWKGQFQPVGVIHSGQLANGLRLSSYSSPFNSCDF